MVAAVGVITSLEKIVSAELVRMELEDDDEPIRIPITDVFDLHTVPPRDVADIVDAYLEEAYAKGFRAIQIIHGKGIGVQREVVRRVLARKPFVKAYCDAPAEAGSWGATIVDLD